MIHVAGGTYREVCRESRWDELYGSGLRAAAVLGGISGGAHLHTYVGEEDRATLEAYEDGHGITASASRIRSTIAFSYAHGLARPWIDPPLQLLEATEPLSIEADVVLRFGILEGDAVVKGKTVVYDPQSAFGPKRFDENGSSADRLAIVANHREGRELTGHTALDDIGKALLTDHGAEVALLKQGASGVRVFHHGGVEDVPAFRTDRVFPIGSGDVFSAVFTHSWAKAGASPVAAAEHASRATAWYCSRKTLHLPTLAKLEAEVKTPLQPQPSERGTRLVYLAGPFFTTADRWLVNEARDALLKQGVRVFSPFHDVGIGPASEVVQRDIDALEECHAVLAIVDGLDAGTLFEVGYARARDIPVVAFVESESEEPLKMLTGTSCEIVDDLVSGIYRATWAALER